MDDRPIADLAARQHALVTWDQVLACGLTPQQVRRRIERGLWARVHVGVYRMAGAPTTYEQSLLAACLAVGPLTAVSHRSAAICYGLLTFSTRPVEITTTRDRSPELGRGVVVHRLADLLRRWVIEIDGIPYTTVARTLVDLGAVCAPSTVEAALDRALGRRLVTLAEVDGVLRAVARQGRRGVGAARRAIGARIDREPAGVLEARMMSLLLAAGLRVPVAEYAIFDQSGRFVARVDFAYPDLRLAIEVDGYESHAALDSFRHDRERQNQLVALGWTVLRYTWAEVDTRSPAVAGGIARELWRLRSAS